jgi:hypothetical protein
MAIASDEELNAMCQVSYPDSSRDNSYSIPRQENDLPDDIPALLKNVSPHIYLDDHKGRKLMFSLRTSG